MADPPAGGTVETNVQRVDVSPKFPVEEEGQARRAAPTTMHACIRPVEVVTRHGGDCYEGAVVVVVPAGGVKGETVTGAKDAHGVDQSITP